MHWLFSLKEVSFQKSCSLPRNSSERNLLSFAMQLPLSLFLLSYNSFLLILSVEFERDFGKDLLKMMFYAKM